MKKAKNTVIPVKKETVVEQKLFAGRIESVQDREVNNKLFTMYASLVDPVKQIENKVAESESLFAEENKMYDIYDTDFIWKGVKVGIICCVIVLVLMLFGLWEFIMDKMSWYYDPLDVFLETSSLPTDGALSIVVGCIFLFLPYLLIPTIISFFLGILEQTFRKTKNGIRRKYIHERTDILKQEINEITKNIAPTVQYVPPKYRTSDALAYFVSAYENSQVDDLKEAVNAYNEQQKHQEIVGTLQGISSSLAGIAYMQLETLKQLS